MGQGIDVEPLPPLLFSLNQRMNMKAVLFGGPCHRQEIQLEPGDGLLVSMEAKSVLFDPETGMEVVKGEADYTPRTFDGGDHSITVWGWTKLSDDEVLQRWIDSRGEN